MRDPKLALIPVVLLGMARLRIWFSTVIHPLPRIFGRAVSAGEVEIKVKPVLILFYVAII